MVWLERRLGTVGETRRRIVEDISSLVGRHDRCDLVTDEEVDTLVERAPKRLDALFPGRGESERVRRILSYGAMLGVVAAGREPSIRGDVVLEAAMFNLGVALFDSVVDEHPAALPTLKPAVRPREIWQSLRSGVRLARVEHPWANAIIESFETMALSVHRRGLAWSDDLGQMLVDMHRSEMSARDRSEAKVLPTRFVGLLADRSSEMTRLFESLARFVALWDDWQDLADDMIHGRANLFLGDRPFPRIVRTAFHMTMAPAAHWAIRRRLHTATECLLVDADAAGRGAETRELIRRLLPEQ